MKTTIKIDWKLQEKKKKCCTHHGEFDLQRQTPPLDARVCPALGPPNRRPYGAPLPSQGGASSHGGLAPHQGGAGHGASGGDEEAGD